MEPNETSQTADRDLADDMLEGAAAIAEYLYRSKSARILRKIYYLAETSRLPIFRLGALLCARKSTLLKFIRDQEERVLAAMEAQENPEPAPEAPPG
jgi:hypothetical protein